MKHYTILFFLTLTFVSQAQKEYHKWYFGNTAGIDFVSGSAVALTNGAMNSTDNPATISDSVGNLLFYSNGLQVWTRNHIVMPNGSGLMGNNTAGHTATIIRKPGSTNLYYIFTLDAFAGANGLRYSVVDMNLNGGFGNVVAGQKNILVVAPCSEQVVPVVHANNTDIWIVTHPWNSSSFSSYLVTSAGVSATPVTSTVGFTRSGVGDNALGQITVNETNDRIACASYGNDRFELFDFDNATGILSNPLSFPNYNNAWGMEFSPDGSKLYLTGWTTQYVYQFDLSTYTQAAINASMVNLGNVTGPGAPYYTGYMQRAPDGKIYLAVYLDPYLAVVNNPNAAGAACNLVDNGFNLSGKTSGAGLPDKIVVTSNCNLHLNLGNDTSICSGSSVVLNATNSNSTYQWQDNSTNAVYTVTAQGTYSVTVTDTAGCNVADSILVSVIPNLSPFTLGTDTTYCGNFTRVLSTGNSSTVWSTGVTASQITVSTAGTYWARQTNQCNTVSDTIVLSQTAPPQFSLPNDTALCPNDSLQLTVTSGSNISWSTGATASSIWVSSPGLYWAEAYNVAGCARRDTIVITQAQPLSPFTLGTDTTYCGNFTRVLSTGNSSTVWSTGATASQITVSAAGTYWARQTNQCNTVSDTIVLSQTTPPQFSLPNDTALCPNDSLQLTVTSGSNISWSTGATASSIWVSSPGLYWAEAYNVAGCTRRDSIVITQVQPLSVFIGNDTTYCGNFNRVLASGNASTVWSTGITGSQITVSTAGVYWASLSNQCYTAGDTIILTQVSPPSFNLPNDTSLCTGDSVLLSVTAGSNVVWSNGSTVSSIWVSVAGIYWAEAFDIPGCSQRDSIVIAQDQIASLNLGADTTFCSNSGFVLRPGIAGAQYVWNDNSTDSIYVVMQSGSYSVTATNGCGSATDNISITYLPNGCQLAIPTAFSPNADGKNDLFRAISYCVVPKFTMRVYNRWGELVFETNDVTEGWNGVFRNTQQPMGVFVYYIEYFNNCSQKRESIAGNVTLLR